MASDTTTPGQRRERLRELRRRRQSSPDWAGRNSDLQTLALDSTAGAGDTEPESLDALVEMIGNPVLRTVLGRELERLIRAPGHQAAGTGMQAEPADYGLRDLEQGYQLSTTSPPEEVGRYRQQLSARADWLDAALEETLLELERAESLLAEMREQSSPPDDPAAEQASKGQGDNAAGQ